MRSKQKYPSDIEQVSCTCFSNVLTKGGSSIIVGGKYFYANCLWSVLMGTFLLIKLYTRDAMT